MGNRAVICFDEYTDDSIGIYVHWQGSKNTIEMFLQKTRELMDGKMTDTQYSTARLVQIIANKIGGNLGIGIDKCINLDCDNNDNGTYVIDTKTMTIKEHLFV